MSMTLTCHHDSVRDPHVCEGGEIGLGHPPVLWSDPLHSHQTVGHLHLAADLTDEVGIVGFRLDITVV